MTEIIPKIDYNKIAYAIEYYQGLGYEYIQVPWLIGREATYVTLPENKKAHDTFDGFLVGSAEQSYIQMMLDGTLNFGKYVTITPCFRNEQNKDKYHHTYFEKVELINYSENVSELDLIDVTYDAFNFFKKYLPVETISTEEGFDIVDKNNKIELGSYGIRKYDKYSWIYATGVAEPRLSQVLELYPKGYHLMDIPKSEYGTLDKITEEVLELRDAENQGVQLMKIQELSDMIGAIEGYLNNKFSDLTLDDLIKMKDVTKRAFESGMRK